MEKQVIRQLIEGYLNGSAANDRERLMQFLQADDELVLQVLNEMQQEQGTAAEEVDPARMFATLQKVLSADKGLETPVVGMNRAKPKASAGRRWWWAAASVVVVLAISISLYNFMSRPHEMQQVQLAPRDIPAPATNHATITLADGSIVFLDSLNSGEVAHQGAVKVIKLADGKIAYQSANGEITNELQYNTLANPRGSKVIDITLADGTRVWLNAGSSITYPVAFLGVERKVELTGEGYFEVANNKEKPFVVKRGNVQVQVLGTHFNVFAYADEASWKVTLLEGAVKVSNKQRSNNLIPGQQAALSETGTIQVEQVDAESAIAWKNGYFNFQGKKLDEVMRQIARWYDIEVVYQGHQPNIVFGGKMERELTLDAVLQILELSKVKFKLEKERKLIVE